jgi:hypothetical protein
MPVLAFYWEQLQQRRWCRHLELVERLVLSMTSDVITW